MISSTLFITDLNRQKSLFWGCGAALGLYQRGQELLMQGILFQYIFEERNKKVLLSFLLLANADWEQDFFNRNLLSITFLPILLLHMKTLPKGSPWDGDPLCRAYANRRDEQSSPADRESSTESYLLLHGMKYTLAWGCDNLSDSCHLLYLLKIYSCEAKITSPSIS